MPDRISCGKPIAASPCGFWKAKNPIVSDNEKPASDLTGTWIPSLTGTWIQRASKFSLTSKGCTAGYDGKLTDNGQDTDKGTEIIVTQMGNQLLIPPEQVTYSGGSSGSYIKDSQGTISGNRFKLTISATPSTGRFTIEGTGTVSSDGHTITGEMLCKTTAGPATAKGTFTWTRKGLLCEHSRFKTMLSEAKELQELAEKLEKDDKAYKDAVVDIVRRGYNSPYAVYMLDVPSEGIPELFKDEAQIRAVRSQIISRIGKKAENRKRFADIGISGNFLPGTPVYSKENITLFCTLDSSKFTKDFWDALWMSGYIDYPLYTETEKKLIVFGYKGYFEKLDYAATLLTLPIDGLFQFGRYALGTGLTKLFLTKLEVSVTKQLASKKLPKIIIEELGSASSSINAVRLRNQLAAKQIVDGHAFEKHVIQEKEFSGITTRQQFQEYLERIMNSPETLVKELSSGRTGFYEKTSNTLIIYNPKAIDKGTAFRPKEGVNYFLEKLK